MPRFNEIIRRPLEFLRRALFPVPPREAEIVRILYPEVLERVKDATGYRDFGLEEPKVGIKNIAQAGWKEKALVMEGPLQLDEKEALAKTVVSPTSQRYRLLIPVRANLGTRYVVVERFFGNRFRIVGDEKLGEAVSRAFLEHAMSTGNKDTALPHVVHIHAVSYTERPDHVIIHRIPKPGSKQALLITLHLEPQATDEELREQVIGFIRRLYPRLMDAFSEH